MKLRNKVLLTAVGVNQAILGTAFATDTAAIDGVFDWLLAWSMKIGIFIVLWGIVSIALAYKSEDSHAMEKGIKTAIAGFMVTAAEPLIRTFM